MGGKTERMKASDPC